MLCSAWIIGPRAVTNRNVVDPARLPEGIAARPAGPKGGGVTSGRVAEVTFAVGQTKPWRTAGPATPRPRSQRCARLQARKRCPAPR